MIEPGTKNGEILRRPPCSVVRVRLLDHRQAADPGADAHADALHVARVAVEPGVLHRLHRRDEAVVDERVVAARFLAGQVLRDVEALHLAGDLRRKRRRVEARDPRDPRAPGEDARPRLRDADADGRNDAKTGDDDATAGHAAQQLRMAVNVGAPRMRNARATPAGTPRRREADGRARPVAAAARTTS